MNTIRIWDLPTRLFHWLLVVSVIGLVVTGKVGGDAMVWHFRLGYTVFALLLFRLVWGFVGGRWSRFSAFWPTPAGIRRYLSGEPRPEEAVGHNPLGALSVLGMLAVLALQVGTGLFSDDEIAFAGPLTSKVSGAVVSQATRYHKDIGQALIITLVLLHVLAVLFYLVRKRQNLVRPMISGDKALPAAVQLPPARDGAGTRLLALGLVGVAAALVAAVVQWGGG